MATESVKHGWRTWEDHSINRVEWTLTEKWATILMAILGVCLSLCWPCILSLILFYEAKFSQAWRGSSRVDTAREAEVSHERSPLIDNSNGHHPELYGSIPAPKSIKKHQAVKRSSQAGSTGQSSHSRHKVRKFLEEKTMLGIRRFRAARWNSKYCGVWKFNSSAAGVDAATRHDIYDRQKEARAGEYAQNCYGDGDILKSGRCNLFYKPTIKYTPLPTWECPFAKDMCVRGIQPMHFYTDLIDPNDIGINSEHLFKFRRNSTCSPLTWDDSYIRNKTSKSGETTYYYEFGSTGHNYNYTYSTTGNPHDWHAPNYVVRTYGTTTPWPQCDAWQPIPQLKPPQNKTVTIIFISALRIFYPKQNLEDPIFPADRAFGSGSDSWYWKSDPKARALACIDSTEMCTYDGAKCWPAHDLKHGGFSDINLPREYWYTKLALENSNTYDSIKARLGDGLVAQGRVSQYQSQDLGENFWRVEAERLFQTSLARIQYDAWAIGTGEDQARVLNDGYVDDAPDEAGDLCGILKFLSTEYRNVPRNLYLWLMSILPVLLLLSMKVKTVVKVGNWFRDHCYWGCCTNPKQKGKGKGKDAESTPPRPNTGADTVESNMQAITQNGQTGLTMQNNPPQNATSDATRSVNGNANGSARGSSDESAPDNTSNSQGSANGSALRTTANDSWTGTGSDGERGEWSISIATVDGTTADAPENLAEGGPANAGSVLSNTTEDITSTNDDDEEEEDELDPPVLHLILVSLVWGVPWACYTGYESVPDWSERRKVDAARRRTSTRLSSGDQNPTV